MDDCRNISAVFSKEKQCFRDRLGREYDFTAASGPYEYLLGALAGCWTYTLMGGLDRTTSFTDIRVDVRGRKRDEVPTTLEETLMEVTVTGCTDEEDFLRAAEKAKMDCSIYQTIKGVSRMRVSVTFVS